MNDMDDCDSEIENIACIISYGIHNNNKLSLEHIISLRRACRAKCDAGVERSEYAEHAEYMNLLEAAKKNFLQRLRQAESDILEIEDFIETLEDEEHEMRELR
jgi:hypothetical protein